jgi:hypothetical protein
VTDYIASQKQRAQEVLRPTRTYVSADPHAYPLTTAEQGVLSQAASSASHIIAHRQMSHLARSDETPVHNALASLIYSAAYALIAAGIALILALLGIVLIGGDERIYVLLAILGWGTYVIRALRINREQGLDYSPAGLEHHEIDARVEMGKYIVDRHIELIEKRWNMKD